MATVSEPTAPPAVAAEQTPSPAAAESVEFDVFRGTPETPQGDQRYQVPMVPGKRMLAEARGAVHKAKRTMPKST